MKRTGYAVAAAVTALVVLTLLTTAPCISQASGKVHIVVKGDTLWDITSFYLYDPFQWPQVWSVNREIENPHLIYPGQEIVIPEMTARTAPPPQEPRPLLPPPPPPEPVTAESVQAEPEPMPEIEPEPAPVTEEVKQEMILAMSTYGFIIDDEEIGIGTITSTEENRLLITAGMKVYVESEGKTPLLTDRRYSIVRVFDQVSHPVTKKKIGFLARVLGDLNVVHSKGKLSTAIVGEVYKEIQVGDHVIEHLDYMTWIPKEENDLAGDLTGYILINTEGQTIMGKGNVVFIDLGIEDGLKTGDTLDLVGTKKTVGGVVTPPQIIGEIQVLVPRPGTSMARITKSFRDIGLGTEVVTATR
ncbi:MAG: LysM peptidoglycan-binding domain-containing protein [bacterium]|nr:LysM peptidoglycan-binding domain-containing protein [bacterium]MDT8365239.1 LysM peptidoglycan-binding domain-containing protein [bacterium]